MVHPGIVYKYKFSGVVHKSKCGVGNATYHVKAKRHIKGAVMKII